MPFGGSDGAQCDIRRRRSAAFDNRKLLEEIEREVSHLEPYTINGPLRCPSTAWCLMFKACMMRRDSSRSLPPTLPSAAKVRVQECGVRLTELQLSEMLKPYAPIYVRGVAFLYLRFTSVPKLLWER